MVPEKRFPTEEVRRLGEKALGAAGMRPEDARIIMDVLVEAELRGRPSHGLVRLPGIVGAVKRKSAAELQVVRDEDGRALIDGGGSFGYLAAYRAMELAIRKAGEKGLGVVGVKNSGHSGMLGYYARMALEKDYIGIALCNTKPLVAAWGGSEAVFGTNPVAIAIPADGTELVLDMSTSSITFGDLLVAAREGRPIAEGLALDAQGTPTTDPRVAQEGVLLPFGGPKGFGLGLVIQLLASALVDQPVRKTGGLLMLSIDPGLFVPVRRFKEEAAAYLQFVKSSRRAPGVQEILLPGERSGRSRQRCLEQGIPLDDELRRELETLANG